MKNLLLIDGMAAVYRAYYALNRVPRINSKGMNTGAVLGFTTSLYDLLRTQQPTHVGVAFDLQKPTFRHEMYAEYKANREAMPEDIQVALPWIRRIIEAMRIPILTCEGFEADDVIGTLAHAAQKEGFDRVLMATPDKDFAQLVTPVVRIYRYGRMGKPDVIMGPEEVYEKFGVADCRQVIDLLGLWGDASDNIPGIPGVGEKTAKKLIAQFGSIEAMIEQADSIKNDKLRNLVKEHASEALFSKQLATIRLDAPVEFDAAALALSTPNYEALAEIVKDLEFRQLGQRIFNDLASRDPQLAQQWRILTGRAPSASASQTAPSAPSLFDNPTPSADAPTLFDGTAQPPSHTIEVQRLDAEALAALLGRDIAIGFEGPTVMLATDADHLWSTRVADLDKKALSALLSDSSTTKLCFDLKNIKYILAELDLPLEGHIVDIQLVHYLVDAEMRHTLDAICTQLIGFEPATAAEATAAMWQLYPLLTARLADADLGALYADIELPLVDVLISMEKEGVRIDTNALQAYSQRLGAERSNLEQQIYELAGTTFNISSPKQLGEVLYDKLCITDRPPRTATKQYSTAEDVLTKLSNAHPIVPIILEYRSLSKLIGTYLDSFPKLINRSTGRLHTVFNQTVTATGRLSSSNPNLQNIPIRTERGREIRRAFVPRDADHLLLAADYSQIELRIIASLAHDCHLMADFNAGRDIHAATAAKIYHLPIEEVSKEQRRNAKSVNFGIVYGISAFGLAEQLAIPRKEAAALIDEYFTQYPDIHTFIESSIEFARQHGYARTLLGRRRYLPDINSRNASARAFAERNAVNMPIQGTSADMIKLAMVRIHRAIADHGLRSRMLIQVHDELLFDLYRPEEAQLRDIVLREMTSALPLEGVPIEVGIDVGENWLEAH